MNKTSLLGAVCATCLLFNPSYISAALVEVDLLLEDDGLITRDTGTNLDWLDVTATIGKSFTRQNKNPTEAGLLQQTPSYLIIPRFDHKLAT